MIKFKKVSKEQYMKDMKTHFPNMSESEIETSYNMIKLPTRATKGSAGYDFVAPVDITIAPNKAQVIPTGIRCIMDHTIVLSLYPRSGHGFKRGIHLANTVGIIDSDYQFSDNEGHIMIKLVNDSVLSHGIDFSVSAGSGFAQGIFTRYEITDDDNAEGLRNGGFGSTTKG